MPNLLGLALRSKRVGYEKLAWARPGLQAPDNFTMSSSAFRDGTPLPEQYRGKLLGRNTAPAVRWTAPPAGPAELVLVVEDADSPFGNPNTHGLAAGIGPAAGGLPEGALYGSVPAVGLKLGKAGPHQGWFGPMPILSHGPHRYVFQLFAVDRRLTLPPRFKLGAALDAMSGHIIGRARLEGTCEKR